MSATQYSPDSLEYLLRNLSLSDNSPDHEEILRHANSVLKSSKGNPRALHTKVVALLNLDRHEDALKVFTSPEGQKIADVAVLERAYCLYKVGKLQEAVELAQKAQVDAQTARALKHIAAQAVSHLASVFGPLLTRDNAVVLSTRELRRGF
jgi:signal recognition particle subunit SRP72